ncbi:TPA: hypothetical protein QB600_002135 [Pasteurella multocida]|nr:hypothetical protein [Pasteurella multocida]
MYSLMVEQTGNQAEITQKQTALLAAEKAQEKWGDKGEYKRTAERLTTLSKRFKP